MAEQKSRRGIGVGAGILIGVLVTLLALALLAAIGFFTMGRCPMCGRMWGDGMPGRMMDGGMQDDEMPGWMMSRDMMSGEMMRDMHVIRRLLLNHGQIERGVEEIPGGIRATTTSDDPETAEAIRTHVRQMKERLEQGEPIRMMDPLFREIFRHREKVELEIEEVPGGVRVAETSEDPEVVLLIRQHALRAVSEFVEGGMRRAMQPTPLPDEYQASDGIVNDG